MVSEKALKVSKISGLFRAAVAISFDYESTAPYGDRVNIGGRIKGWALNALGRSRKRPFDLSFYFGIGYAMRLGADNIIKILQKHGMHATWFATGHALLRGNRDGRAYRINQKLAYASRRAGFSELVTWRRELPTFHYEPRSDYREHPYWYLGDQAGRLREIGEDIQYHTFSHPYIALEPPENVVQDIEDWQIAALNNGFGRASICSFPFCGDAYRYYPGLELKAMIGAMIAGQPCEVVRLTNAAVKALAENGIELVTRCGSMYGSVVAQGRFRESGLYWMPDVVYDPAVADIDRIKHSINEYASLGSPLNVWMHPSNVFTDREIEGFEKLVDYLARENRLGNVWAATIKDIWSYCKKAEQCTVEVRKMDGNRTEAVIKNNGATPVENLGLEMVDAHFRLSNASQDLQAGGDRINVRRLAAQETVRLTLEPA